MSASIIEQVVKQLSGMPQSLQQQVLQFARVIGQGRRQGTSGRQLLRCAGMIPIDELSLMQDAIEQDCGKVDLDEW